MLDYAERTISHLLISSGSPHAHMQTRRVRRVPATRPDGQTHPYHTQTGLFSCSEVSPALLMCPDSCVGSQRDWDWLELNAVGSYCSPPTIIIICLFALLMGLCYTMLLPAEDVAIM
ncbi:unnamed protein product [Leuciscus chuanchicus]